MTANLQDPVDVVARTCWGEARGLGQSGMLAVAFVIRNRAVSPRWWGTDFVTVCLQAWQFSCWNENDPNRAKLIAVTAGTDQQFAEALAIADQIVCGKCGEDITLGADSYYSIGIAAPDWTATAAFTTQIDTLRFYRTVLAAPVA